MRSILQETFLSEACAVAYDGERSIESLQRLVTLAEGYSLSTPATLGQFLSRVQELMEQELSKLTASNQGEIADAVEVMTVHKSKGLEFPVVILVDISKKEVNNTAKRPAHLYSWRYDLHGFRIGKYADMNLAWLEEQEQTHSRCEEIRVLYVALTRAKEKLLLVGNQIADDTSMAGLFMRAGLFPALQEQGTTPPAKVGACGLAVQYTSYVSPEKFIYKFPASLSSRVVTEDLAAWRRKENVRLQEYKQYKEASSILAPSALAGDNEFENEQAMHLGSLVHEILAHCSRDKALDVENVLQQRGVLPGELLYQDVLSMLKAFEHSVAYQQLTAMQVLGTELPFSLYNNQEVVSGVIDLLSQDKDGIVWVIDYKTDKVKPGMEQESAQKYTAQLSVYAQAAQRLYPSNKVQSAVVFVRNGIVIKL